MLTPHFCGGTLFGDTFHMSSWVRSSYSVDIENGPDARLSTAYVAWGQSIPQRCIDEMMGLRSQLQNGLRHVVIYG